jgi:hypothetical protein
MRKSGGCCIIRNRAGNFKFVRQHGATRMISLDKKYLMTAIIGNRQRLFFLALSGIMLLAERVRMLGCQEGKRASRYWGDNAA